MELPNNTTGQNYSFGTNTKIQWLQGNSREELDKVVYMLVQKAHQHKEQFLSNLNQMQELIELKKCVNVFVASYFGCTQAPCGHCSFCFNQKEKAEVPV